MHTYPLSSNPGLTLLLTKRTLTNPTPPASDLSPGMLESSSRRSSSHERRVSITDGPGGTGGGIGLRRPSFSNSRPNSPYEIQFTTNSSHNSNSNHSINHHNNEATSSSEPSSIPTSTWLPQWVKVHHVAIVVVVVVTMILLVLLYSTQPTQGRAQHGRYHHRLVY